MRRMREVRADISLHDAAERFRDEWKVDVFYGNARFAAPDAIDVDGQRLTFAKAITATGSRPKVPKVPGLAEAEFLTSESVFNLSTRPPRLAILGGGPIGCELAQAFVRLGSHVTLLQKGPRLLPREEPEISDLLRGVLMRERIDVQLNANVERVENGAGTKTIRFRSSDGSRSVEVDAILVAIGRAPRIDGLELGSAGVVATAKGITVDDHLRTSNPRIFAAGDVCLPWQFTHMADASARLALQNALLLPGPFRRRLSRLIVPWCTYTDPEIAHVGMDERQAREKGLAVRSVRVDMREVDRAQTDGETEGFLNITVTKRSDRVLGATLVARHAGEMIAQISTAMVAGMGLKKLAEVIHPYPTQAEVIHMAADRYFQSTIRPMTRGLLRRWFAWRR